MNKNIKKVLITTLACVTLCGTAMAAPGGRGKPAPAPARQHQQAAPRKQAARHAPAKHVATRPAPVRPVVHHPAPPPPRVCHPAPPPPPPPRTVVIHEVEEDEGLNGWEALGAAVIGGIIGALVT